jgi:hypothetical protein
MCFYLIPSSPCGLSRACKNYDRYATFEMYFEHITVVIDIIGHNILKRQPGCYQASRLEDSSLVFCKMKYRLYSRQPFYYGFGGFCFNVAFALNSVAVANERSTNLGKMQCVQTQPLPISNFYCSCCDLRRAPYRRLVMGQNTLLV